MTDAPDETIVIRYIVEAQDAIAKAKEFRAQVDSIKAQLKEMAASSGQSFKDLAVGMQQVAKANFQSKIAEIREVGKTTGQTSAQIKEAVSAETAVYNQYKAAVSQAYQEVSRGAKTGAESAKSSLSSIAIGVAAAFGITAINMIRQFFQTLINYMQQAIQSGYEFTKGLYQINVGVNALRRAGTDITFGDVLKQLQKLKSEFGIFSTKDLVVGASAFLNLNRDMGFTKEQLFDLQEAIATLAVVNGRAMDEVQKTVALALSSGYTEGLQRLGVSINRVTIAEEAARLGYAKSYMALTEVQRAEATYNLILQKTKVYAQDLYEYQKTLPGAIDATTAAITDANAKVGASLLGLKYIWEQLKLAVVQSLAVPTESDSNNITRRLNPIVNAFRSLQTTASALSNVMRNWGDIKSAINDALNVNIDLGPLEKAKKLIEDIKRILGGTEVAPPEVAVKIAPILTDEQIDSVNSANKQILDLQEQYNNDRRDLEIDLQRDLLKIDEDAEQKAEEQTAEHYRKLIDIASKAADDIANATSQYDLNVQQTWDDYYSNLASDAEKHNNKLLKIEADYQEKLLRIKEGFLMDLEEALEQRDARQVLNLIKRYNLDRVQATRERDQNLKDEEVAYRQQLRDLDRQRDDRLRKLRQEFDLRLQMINDQKQKEIDAENARYEQQQLDEQAKWLAERKARTDRYKNDLDDLALHLKDRTDAIAQGLINDGIATAEGLQGILDITNSFIGANGAITQVWANFIAYIQSAMNAVAMAASIPQWIGGTIGNYNVPNPPTQARGGVELVNIPHKSYAGGGMEIANKPTTAVFGDAGPELHLFIPLTGSLGNLSSPGKSPLPVMKAGEKGKLQVEIMLGQGLEGRIIDKTMNNVANVVLRSIKQ